MKNFIKRNAQYILPLVGFFLILLINVRGIGLSPDAVSYLTTTRSLLSGHGLLTWESSTGYIFLSHFPPLFPLLLIFTGAIVVMVPVLQGLLMAAILVMIAKIVKLFNVGQWGILFAQCLVLLSSDVLWVFTYMWSEPFFIVALLLIVFFALRYIERKQGRDLVWLCAISSLLPLVRYAGLFILPWVVVTIVWNNREYFKDKVRILKLVLVSGSLFVPYGLWQLLAQSQGGVVRKASIHIVKVGTLWQGVQTLAGWFSPYIANFSKSILLLILAFAVGILFYALWRVIKTVSVTRKLQLLFVWSIVPLYIFFLLVSISFLDAGTPLDGRILSVLVPVLAVAGIASFSNASQAKVKKFLVLFLLVVSVLNVSPFFYAQFTRGAEYSYSSVALSPTLRYACVNLQKNVLVSNISELITTYCNKPAYAFPFKYTSRHSLYSDYLDSLRNVSKKSPTGESFYVVWFFQKSGVDSQYGSSLDFSNLGTVEKVKSLEDGEIYQVIP